MPDFTPTEEQAAILGHNHTRHARILAGPGTGKSATVVAWLDDLLTGEGSPRSRLLTFTRAATGELAKKVSEHPQARAQQPGTVHSFSIATLLRNPGVADFPEPLRIADDWEQEGIVVPTLARRIGLRQALVRKLFVELAAGWESLDEFLRDPDINDDDRSRFRAAWLEHRRIYGYTLLGELPFTLRHALRTHPDLQGVDYELLIVDEYQDLNPCDLEVLQLLAERGCCVVAVGDDDQSIYSFRCADPVGIRRFCERYEGAADYPLSITHRCGSRVIGWASHVIEGDLSRGAERRRLTPADGSPPGEVGLLSFAGHRAEARGVAEVVKNLIEREEVDPAEILILLRSDYRGTFSNPIKEELDRRGIAYSDPEMIRTALGAEETRRLLARLRLLTNRQDSLAWATLLELESGVGEAYRRGIYDEAVSGGRQFGEALLEVHARGTAVASPAVDRRAIRLIDTTLEWLDAQDVPDETPDGGWGHWIVELTVAEGDDLRDDAVEILTGVDGMSAEQQVLGQYLAQLVPLAKDRAHTESRGVRIMTMAASKGLTVEATIIPALENGIMPRDDHSLDEERRLLYVAMTRSKKFLYGTWARVRRGPTARAGGRDIGRRRHTSFLDGGPVVSEDGTGYIEERWG